MEEKKFTKRDHLIAIENRVQEMWYSRDLYQVDAKENTADKKKYFINFPYPYMNGKLHLGHGYSMSKCEFVARYKRMKGYHVLFPFGFHCTGMPIAACADKLKREFKDFPEIENCDSIEKRKELTKKADEEAKALDPDGVGYSYQWDIMFKMGIPLNEITNFRDSSHWLLYFPPIAREDLKKLGVAVDWRRTFITTDLNPYYNKFIEWQFKKLKDANRIHFGKRNTVYSIKDGQPCADHDRATGEGVGPQEYTLIKLKVLPPFKGALAEFEGKFDVFLVAATLRAETMYGQTNCFLLPTGNYGAYEMKNNEVYICSHSSARNMAWQDLTKRDHELDLLKEIKGDQLMGLPLKAPLSKYDVVYSLPMMTISMDKATGVVTSVPSDAPDDLAALRDLQKKEALREKFGITKEMVDFEPIPIIEVPGWSKMTAVDACEEFKVKSQNEKDKLALAKEKCYNKGFYEGILTVGEFAGQKVQDAKNLVRDAMIEQGLASLYFEPESKVMSRSGDICIVTPCDQWYLTYGEESWKKTVVEHVKSDNFSAYHDTCQHAFEETLDWLSEWACSRNYGLGTNLPWDPQYVIESLSDSTIYMAYYTIVHLIQGGDLVGSTYEKPLNPEDFTEGVFDYVFLKKDYPADCAIPEETLSKMRNEFEFWYPFDLRASAKDLIRNHLTMCLYNHASLWGAEKMPRSFFCNGYINVDGKKMSKSLGNFLTIQDCLKTYGADATRFAAADSGDTLGDANFEQSTANSAILKLYTFEQLVRETCDNISKFRQGHADSRFGDRVFANEMNRLVRETENYYESVMFKAALKSSFFDLQLAQHHYRIAIGGDGYDMNAELLLRFFEIQTLMLTPICPHFAENLWSYLRKFLNRESSELVIDEPFPSPTAEEDKVTSQAAGYVHHIHRLYRQHLEKLKKPKKGKKGAPAEVAVFTKATIYVSENHPGLDMTVLNFLAKYEINADNEFVGNWKKELKDEMAKSQDKKELSKAMQFGAYVAEHVKERARDALAHDFPFDQKTVITESLPLFLKDSGIEVIEVRNQNDEKAEGDTSNSLESATPLKPQFFFAQRISEQFPRMCNAP